MKTLARCRLAGALALALMGLAPTARAQAPATPAAPAPAQDGSVSDRVKKDAASPLYWIRLNAQKADAAKPAPRITEVRSEPRAPRQAPAPAAAAAATNPAPAAAVTATAAPVAAPTPTTDTAAAPAALATPAALVAPGSTATDTARAATEPPDDEPDDQPLAVVKADEPEFAASLMRKLRKGTVQVRFEVQADGSVANASVVQTSHRSLNAAALEAVSAWRFQPVRNPRSAVVDVGFDLDG